MDVFETLSSVIMLTCSLGSIIFALGFIIIVAINHQCHTVNNFLVFNSAVAGFMIGVTYMCQSIYQLADVENDILCSFRGFLLHTGTGLLYHTLCVTACHRLIVTVYSTRRFLQTKRFSVFLVVLQWFISCTFGLPCYLTGGIIYQVDARICEMPIQNRWGYIYFVLMIVIFPLLMIIVIYIRIVKYMKISPFSSANGTNLTSQQRKKSEFRLIRRILIIVITLCILGLPKTLSYIAIEIHLIPPWPYMTRVDRMFITFGQSATMLINLLITDDVKKVFLSVIKKCLLRKNRVHCIAVVNMPNQMI